MKRWVWLLAVVVACTDARATDELHAIGLSNVSCGTWVKERRNIVPHSMQLEFVLGFVTGSNYRTEGQGQPADIAAAELFVDQYCQNNPLHQLFMAAAALVQESGGPPALHQFKK